MATLSLAGLETAFPFLAFDRLGATTRSVGLLVSAAALLWIAFAQSVVAATAALALYAAGHGLIRPANASLVTQRTRVGQGLAIGVYDSMDALGRVLGPIVDVSDVAAHWLSHAPSVPRTSAGRVVKNFSGSAVGCVLSLDIHRPPAIISAGGFGIFASARAYEWAV